jgi:hypothetical protein
MKRVFFIGLLALIGCNETRSIPPDQASSRPDKPSVVQPDNHRDQDSEDASPAQSPIISPIYSGEIVDVENALIRAISSYMHHVDEVDRKNHVIRVVDDEFWAGNTETNFTLVKQPDGRIRVDGLSQSHGNPSIGGVRERHVLKEIFQRLDIEMQAPPLQVVPSTPTVEDRLRTLDQLHDQGLITDDEYQSKRKEILKGL